MVSVIELLCEGEILPHGAHFLYECLYTLEQDLILEILQYLVAVLDSLDVAEGRVEKRLEIILLPACRDGFDYLIQIQIAEKGVRLGRFFSYTVFGPFKRYTMKNHATNTP